MLVVLGLGNPGAKYEHTRHNVGFDAVNRVAAFFQVSLRKRCFRNYCFARIPNSDSQLIRPLTFMNNSGLVIKHFNKEATFVVICDNMDLPVGAIRIRKGGGSSGQKGLDSIAQALGTSDFIRIYIGIGRPEEGVSVVDHVLSRETGEKKEILDGAIERASQALVSLLNGVSLENIQLEYNRKKV